ncbi:ribosomal RNA small subunit methyltransferase D [Klebsiella oxytoca]|nr:ribosomal RNA small subunit methyltransferase D [Klebsiella oxytoca]
MKKPNHAGSGQIRIIGGQWRGRKLPVPESPGLRPTTDRVRETLFNWLAPSIVDASCLDCFAGSGALGLEALSRYAANATLLEMERGVAQQLQKNLATLKASNGKVVNTNTLAFLAQAGTPHHIVFVDPPFRKGLLEETLKLLENNGWLSDEALIYIESEVENGLPPVPVNWHPYREKSGPDRSPTVSINVRHKEKTMLINFGPLADAVRVGRFYC